MTTDHDQQEFSNWYIHNDVWLGRSAGWDEGTSDYIAKISVRGEDAQDEPYVTEISRHLAPSGGAYQVDDPITVIVLFNEAVDVTGNPRIPLMIGSATRQAEYIGKSAAGLNFSYTVQVGDYDADGYHVVDSSLRRNGGTIKRAGTDKNADLDHPALAADSDYAVDARATAPEAPTGLTATALGATIVDLAWTRAGRRRRRGDHRLQGRGLQHRHLGVVRPRGRHRERERLVPPHRAFQRRHPALPGSRRSTRRARRTPPAPPTPPLGPEPTTPCRPPSTGMSY